ncbi:MAG: N-acetyltransferase family protein [Thermoplasmatota archaeon]
MISFRPASGGDVERIIDLTLEFENYLIDIDDSLMSEPLPRERYKDTLLKGLDDPKHLFLVAEDDTIIIGFIDYWYYPEFLHGGLTGYMNNLYIQEGYRGLGIGTQLVNEVIRSAKEKGVVAMHVPVKPGNHKAIEFYKKMGIKEMLAMMEIRLDG